MRAIAIAAVVGLLATPALADTVGPFAAVGITFAQRLNVCAAAWQAMTPADHEQTTYRAYTTACIKAGSDGTARTPAPPAGAIAKCGDNTYITSRTQSGACSANGGVDMYL